MSPKTKVLKQDIIDAAFEIADSEGLREISVRKVASKLNCSVAPIYVNFDSSEGMINRIFKIKKADII
jgi:AcrR family transcriptional regulator